MRSETVEVQTFDTPPQRRTALASAAPVRTGDGEIVGAVQVAMDIGDRVRAELALREADRRKDEFLAMLAHELRNPLAPIRSAADLLALGRIEGERLRQTSAVIVRQVRHMTGMIDDLLDISRVTRGLVQLDITRLDLKLILAEAAEQVRPLVESRRHRLELRTTAGPAFVMGDHKRLVQILANILGNAAKYTPHGGRIDASIECDGGRVIVRVRDNGIGMTPDLIARAFELFTQGDRDADRSQGGLGIGLALVNRLVKLHGGKVRAHSEGPGQGTCITLELAAAEGQPGSAAQAGATATRTAPGRSLEVLVVDDNEDAAEMLAFLVEALGHRARIEHDPASALKAMHGERFDACLLDIGLPGIDGYQLAARIRQELPGQSPLLVAVTGYGHEHDRARALAAGFDRHFVKPVDGAELARLLDAQREQQPPRA